MDVEEARHYARRDRFIAAALTGILAGHPEFDPEQGGPHPEWVARTALDYADTVMHELYRAEQRSAKGV